MTDRDRRFTCAAIVLPILLLAMSGSARAVNIITVDTTSPTSVIGHCNLSDAILAANTPAPVDGCATGIGDDTIEFSVSGTITLAATLNITDSKLTIIGPAGGITIDGGGVRRIMSVVSGINLTLQNLTLTGGFDAGGGGGISVAGSNLTITGCTFSDNHVNADIGGAILAFGMGAVVITNSTFVGNLASFGGAIYDGGATGASLTITNSTFSGNYASTAGADLASKPGASLRGTIFADAGSGGHCSLGSLTDAGYNISDDDSCGFSGTSVNNSTTLFLDPGGLANNGGPTETIALPPISQAVDFIPVADCIDQSTGFALTTDQRGMPRPDAGNPNFCDAGAYELQTSIAFVLGSERVQIARSSQANSDEVNMGLTFTHLLDPTCDAGDDALNSGIMVALYAGSCGGLAGPGLSLNLDPFVVHTVNHQSYGTIFQSFAPETVSARMVALPTPIDTCGKWTLNLEVAGLDTAALGLGGGNPFALVLTDSDLHGYGCFDINNAIVGSQIPTPGHGVRRGVRRQTRR